MITTTPFQSGPAELQRPDGARIALYVDGPAHPELVIVLAHGWQAAASTWDELVRQLPTGRTRVVRYDQRGHGASSQGRARPSTALLADDLKAVIAATAPGRLPVVLVGHSMGGMSALGLAAQHPHLIGEKVAAVVLAATTSGGLDTSAPGHPFPRRLRGLTRHTMAAVALRAPRPAGYVRTKIRPRPYVQPPIDVAALWFQALMQHNVVGRLRALSRIPVHILVGEADQMIPAVHALRLAGEIPTARIHVVPDGSHRLPTQHPEAVLAALEEACLAALRTAHPWRALLRRRRRTPASA
ncbi:alpha/beta hydrolase [Streptomyces europaeiscabiei]|uniref:alpha/beta fold hydrolase n=1 Tax=Streptomyces europaeiscabiei TaxID=146819 RepID=UPI0029BD26ED|nr:alpha/beta hydrolase [Streptomyces europaeiscabiei]MDX3694848.1 alpha/beta hydrolase [Streptomyces europaeiscabiei]